MHTEQFVLNEPRRVTLTAYLQPVGREFRYVTKRPALLILPGGGYQYCSEREADPVAFPYLKAGFQVFILRYSVAQDAVWPNPLNDYDQAMELIRRRAADWGLDPEKVAVIGFSAGGHLAAAAATMARNRPNAAILGYAVAGEDVKGCCPSAPDTIPAVDRHTCPCFLFSTRNDQTVPIQNSIRFMEALAAADISFESHIYAYGPHGFSTGDTAIQDPSSGLCPRARNWVQDSIGWLRDIFGDFGPDGFTAPACGRYASHDYDPVLSVDCTIGHLLDMAAAAPILAPVLDWVQTTTGMDRDAMLEQGHKMQLRGLLGFLRYPKADLEALDAALHTVTNE